MRASPEEAVERISAALGVPAPPTSRDTLRPYDDWRDWERSRQPIRRRRIWIGREGVTSRLKVVHSPHVDRFRDLCPTYSHHGIQWLEAWGWPGNLWSPLKTLHPLDVQLVDLWTELVTRFGFGPHDARLGWLQEGTGLKDVRERLLAEGLREDISV